ncbi:MAG: hypothetical protein RLZZ241_1971 [Bacteroidota bacterium]|jgi:methionyl-tRNA formyltransferase
MNTNRNLRIVFMGTPEFAVGSLEALIVAGYKIVAVVTAPDRPAGRGRKLGVSAVKKFAESQNLPVLQPQSLKDSEFLTALATYRANLQIVVAFRMLPKVVWEMPEYGTFNLHASLLPNYRGAAPINWAIINGERETGLTTFFIDDKIDTGQIILQEKIEIGSNETAGELHDRLMVCGGQLVVKTAAALQSGAVQSIPQVISGLIHEAPKLTRENCRVNWNSFAHVIFNQVRGLNPYPAAWTELINGTNRVSVKILKVMPGSQRASKKPGSIDILGRKMWVHTADNLLEIEELQLEGKSRMHVSDLLNGFTPASNAHFL